MDIIVGEIISEFDILYDDFKQGVFDAQTRNPNTYIPDRQFIISQVPPPPNPINDILTKAVASEFLKTDEKVLNIINLYTRVYNHAINKYIAENTTIGVTTNNLKFILKGGVALWLLISRRVHEMPASISDLFMQLFVSNIFTRSDIDFAIIVNYADIHVSNHFRIFNDLFNLSIILLMLCRNYINKYKYVLTDFDNKNSTFQKVILSKIRNDINNTLTQTTTVGKPGDNFCKISIDNLIEEAPCSNDVKINNEIIYYEFYIHDSTNFNIVYANRPKKFGTIDLTEQNKYIITTNTIKGTNRDNQIVAFGLTRMKVYFPLYNQERILNEIDCCGFFKGKGEIIDVSINHPENTSHIVHFSDYITYDIDNYKFNMPTLKHFVHELYYLAIKAYKNPFADPKFHKRLSRFFALWLLDIMNNTNNVSQINNIIALLKDIQKYLKLNNKSTDFNTNTIFSLNLNGYNFNIVAIDEFMHKMILFIQNVFSFFNVNNYNDNYNKFNDIVAIIDKNIINSVVMLEKAIDFLQHPQIGQNSIILTNRLLMSGGKKFIMSGGFSMCNNQSSSHILKNVLNIMTSHRDINTINLKSTTSDRFYACYNYLINAFLEHNSYRQVYVNNKNNIIYDTNTDASPYMFYSSGNRKILKNTPQIVTAFVFLNFLIDYHCFLITYENLKININGQPFQNNYKTLNWDKYFRREEQFKIEFNKQDPVQLITQFCNDLNERYYRFLTLLLINLKNTLGTLLPVNLPVTSVPFVLTIDELKFQMFATNHKRVNKYSMYSIYNYMFYNWKNRLADFIVSKFNGLHQANYPIVSGINSVNYHTYILTQINDTIQKTIKTVLEQHRNINDIYFADGVGLFGKFHILGDKVSNNIKRLYYSCVTNTILEMYLLGRIYEEDFGYCLEQGCADIMGQPVYTCQYDPNYRHSYWKITQDETNMGMSHWVGNWRRDIYKNNAIVNESYHFRSVYPNTTQEHYLHKMDVPNENDNHPNNKVSITNSKKLALKFFMYVPIDYRTEFIKQNNPFPQSVNRIQELRDIVDKIKNMINIGVVFGP